MEKVDILIRALEPEIDMKCAEIKQKKREGLLTGVFISVAVLMLIIPVTLIFFGVSLFTIFIPIVFAGTVFLMATPMILNKGAESYEQV